MINKRIQSDLMHTAESLVDYGRQRGADEMEISVADGNEFNLDVRMGRIENLVQAGSRSLSLRVIKDRRSAAASSSDLTPETLRRLVDNAIERALLAHPDEFQGLPEDPGTPGDVQALDLFDPEIERITPQTGIDLALRTENVALSDPRINNSHGASFETRDVSFHLANSRGFSGSFRETLFHLSVGLQAGDTDNLVEGYWSSSERHLGLLEKPEEIARRAVSRTVRHLNPRKPASQIVPVIFEPEMTAWVLGFLFMCVSGVSVYNRASFLCDRLGSRIGPDYLTVVDDGRLPGRLGTAPFDAEGVACRRTMVIEQGNLKEFLCNTYAARKLGRRSTGNSSGSGVGPTNFYLEAGPDFPEDMIRSMDRGMILTRVLGQGLNPVTGDFSRGAFGLWVENGEVTHPVSEITLSGNLGALLEHIDRIGGDLDFRGQICGPTILVSELQIAGN